MTSVESGNTTQGKSGNTTQGSVNTTQAKKKAKPSGNRSIDAKTRARVRKLARDGKSQGFIARECGIAQSSVKRICDAAKPPITFNRAKTAAAVEAHTLDLKLARAKLSEQAIERVGKLFDLLDAEHTVFHFDKDGYMSTGTLDRPTSGDVKNYITSIGILIDKHIALIKHDSDDRDLPAVDKWLMAMIGGER